MLSCIISPPTVGTDAPPARPAAGRTNSGVAAALGLALGALAWPALAAAPYLLLLLAGAWRWAGGAAVPARASARGCRLLQLYLCAGPRMQTYRSHAPFAGRHHLSSLVWFLFPMEFQCRESTHVKWAVPARCAAVVVTGPGGRKPAPSCGHSFAHPGLLTLNRDCLARHLRPVA